MEIFKFKPSFGCLFMISIASTVFGQQLPLKVMPGRFKPTEESLKTYQAPQWFRDAKFGIWAHWGPQAVPRQGDW